MQWCGMITPEERKKRARTVGGSDIGAILGWSPFSNAYDVWMRKKYPEQCEDIDNKPAIVFGNIAEKPIFNACAFKYTKMVYSPTAVQNGAIRGNFDGISDNCIIEYKTASSHQKEKWHEKGVPATYWAQAQTYMYLSGKTKTDLWVYFTSQAEVRNQDVSGIHYAALEKFEIKRCDQFIAEIVNIAEEFKERFLIGDEVPFDYRPKINITQEDLQMAEAQQSVLDALGIKPIDKTYRRYKSIVVYGKPGTGKTTFATNGNGVRPFIIDIRERGASVASGGHVIEVKSYAQLFEVIKNIREVKKATNFNVLVFETLGKLRDIVLEHVMASNNHKKAQIQDYGEVSSTISKMLNIIIDLQEEMHFHVVFTGHEATSSDTSNNGEVINATVTVDVQDAIQKMITTSVDIVARTMIENKVDEDGSNKGNYVLSVAPSDLYVTKIRKRPNITLNETIIENPNIIKLVRLAETGTTQVPIKQEEQHLPVEQPQNTQEGDNTW